MKIKLSKKQWETIGKTAGWMKMAQQGQQPTQSVKFQQGQQLVKTFFDSIKARHGGTISESRENGWRGTYLEFIDEAIGTMYIQISLDLKWDFNSKSIEASTKVRVERYYDNETLADRYNKTVHGEISLLDMPSALATTESLIQNMKVGE